MSDFENLKKYMLPDKSSAKEVSTPVPNFKPRRAVYDTLR